MCENKAPSDNVCKARGVKRLNYRYPDTYE
jgi:hypothetical protein